MALCDATHDAIRLVQSVPFVARGQRTSHRKRPQAAWLFQAIVVERAVRAGGEEIMQGADRLDPVTTGDEHWGGGKRLGVAMQMNNGMAPVECGSQFVHRAVSGAIPKRLHE